MDTATAVTLINEQLVFPIGWEVVAKDHSSRFGETIVVDFKLTDARQSERAEAPEGYPNVIKGGARSGWPIYVGDVENIEDLTYKVIGAMLRNASHEIREFVRVKPTYWAPFHPHRGDGIKRWSQHNGTPESDDYLFGLT